MKRVFSSEHIDFVEVSEQLIGDYLAMVNDYENVQRFIGDRTEPYTEAQEVKWVSGKLEEKAPVFSMLERESGAFIGNIELMDVKDGVGELGIAVTAAMQDRGFGTEAVTAITEYGLRQLGLHEDTADSIAKSTAGVADYLPAVSG